MNSILTTALMGLFVWAGSTGTDTSLLAQAEPKEVPSYTVAMTAYNAVPEQTDGDPFTTASGAYSNPEIVAARSVDLADELPFGTVIEIRGPSTASTSCGYSVAKDYIGLRVIADSMHSRKRNQIDILFGNDEWVRVGGKSMNPALAMGICKDVEIRVVGKVEIKNMPDTQAELKAMIGRSALTVNK